MSLLLWGEGSFWEGTIVPVDGVLEGRGCLPAWTDGEPPSRT